jgi:hypothetical protein
MPVPSIRETPAELAALERQNPLMLGRLRWLRLLAANPRLDVGAVADQLGVYEYEIERWAALYTAGGIGLLLNPRTIHSRVTLPDLTFSQHAENRMWDLLKSHADQMGRQLWIDFNECKTTGSNRRGKYECNLFEPYKDFEAKFKDWYRSDCQTYILDVLKFAYEKTGQREVYRGLMGAFKKEGTTGTVMCKYLVRNGWKAYLFMPDTDNPSDGKSAHTKMYKNSLKSKTWWGVPLTDFIVNYNPTSELMGGVKEKTKQDEAGKRKFDSLSNVGFSVCVFTEGLHTALHSKGMIYEVHWDVLSEQSRVDNPNYTRFYASELYERSPLWGFGWLEGIIVIPPDSGASIG